MALTSLIPISETQLLFGYFHSYIKVNRPKHFIFPSIRQEGGRVNFLYPGADLVIENNWLIQFKRPNFFSSARLKEFSEYSRPANFNPPFYRFFIKNNNPTNQLNKLIDATRNGFRATYISPLFTNDRKFFRLLKNDVQHLENYAHIDVAQFDGMQRTIGRTNKHTILYNRESVNNGFCYCFSKPILLKATKTVSQEGFIQPLGPQTLLKSYNYLATLFFKNDFPSGRRQIFNYIRNLQERLLREFNISWVIKLR